MSLLVLVFVLAGWAETADASNEGVRGGLLARVDSTESHPRLFVDAGRLQALRAAIEQPGTHHYEAFRAMKDRVDAANWRVYDANPDDGNWNYARSWLAREAALTYLLTGTRRYAQIAYDALYAIHNDPDPDGRLPEASYGLARAMTGMGFAIAYDWAYHGWTPDQRAYVRQHIEVALDAWPDYHHANLETDHLGSNWVAVCRGGELVMMLAAYEEEERARRYRRLKQALLQHMETAYGPSGWSQEGIRYISYASQFLLPALYATQSIGDTDFDAALASIQWHRLQMAVGAFTPTRHHLMSGVDTRSGLDDQGWTSLLLNAVPDAEQPYYRFFYDRHMGVLAPNRPPEKYDPYRAGTTWALLYYPEDVPAANPSGSLRRTLFDAEKGMYYFRNRWADARDILVSMAGDYTHHSHAWDTREAFQLGLVAYGTPFIGGPGKAGTDADREAARGYSTLLVDGRPFAEGGRVGAPVVAEADSAGGGYVVVDGGEKYEALGLRAARRHLMVRFPEGPPGAILSTFDRVAADTARTFTWQLNLGGAEGDDGLRVGRGRGSSSAATFVLRGDGPSFVKGWVLHPAEAIIERGDPLRVHVTGTDAAIWVVMVVGTGTPPDGQVTGTGRNAVLQLANQRVRYDAEANRIRLLDGAAAR